VPLGRPLALSKRERPSGPVGFSGRWVESVRTGYSCCTCTCAFGVALTLQVWKSVDITFQSASRRFMSAVLSLYEETSQLKRSARKSCSTQIPEPKKMAQHVTRPVARTSHLEWGTCPQMLLSHTREARTRRDGVELRVLYLQQRFVAHPYCDASCFFLTAAR
jgi:hypothetical protein